MLSFSAINRSCITCMVFVVSSEGASVRADVFADAVISYEAGTTVAQTFDGVPYDRSEVALGHPQSFSGVWHGFSQCG